MFENLMTGDYKYTREALTQASVFGIWITNSFYKANAILYPTKGFRKKRPYIKRKGVEVDMEEDT